jgi:hypothetical protein
VGREKWFTVNSEVFFISLKHTIEPWKKLLGTVIRVKNNWNTVSLSDLTNVESTSNGTKNRSFLVLVGDTLTSVESRTTIGELNDDWSLNITSSF